MDMILSLEQKKALGLLVLMGKVRLKRAKVPRPRPWQLPDDAAAAAAVVYPVWPKKPKKTLADKKPWSKGDFLRRRCYVDQRETPDTELYRQMTELRNRDDEGVAYRSEFGLTPDQFDLLLKIIRPSIVKKTTNVKKPISAQERLAICLRYLTTGDPIVTIAAGYRLGFSTIAVIVRQVCKAIWEKCAEKLMPAPSEEDWKKIVRDFRELHNFPNCLGAVGGKRIVFQATGHSNSLASNCGKIGGNLYKVLLAVVDANCRFRIVNIGGFGLGETESVLSDSTFGQALLHGKLNIPGDTPIGRADDGRPVGVPHVFVANEAFPFLRNMLRPFDGGSLSDEEQHFNDRLSMVRSKTVDVAFDLLASEWKVYHRIIGVKPETAESIVKATLILHNLRRWNLPPPSSSVPEPNRLAMIDLDSIDTSEASEEAVAVRDKISTCLTSEASSRTTWS